MTKYDVNKETMKGMLKVAGGALGLYASLIAILKGTSEWTEASTISQIAMNGRRNKATVVHFGNEEHNFVDVGEIPEGMIVEWTKKRPEEDNNEEENPKKDLGF